MGDRLLGAGSFHFHIAIDFGTYGSGFAYQVRADGDNVKTYEYWPGQRGLPAAKTRSALLYKLADVSRPVAWGWEAVTKYAELGPEERPGYLLLESFKRYLMPTDFTDLPRLPACLSIKKLVADFLSCMVELVNTILKSHYGAR